MNEKKKAGAVVAAVITCVVLLVLLAFIIFAFWSSRGLAFPLVFYAALLVCAIVGTIVALRLRFKEINSGEEDEARKY